MALYPAWISPHPNPRYKQLRRFLHVVSNQDPAAGQGDRRWKVQPWLDRFTRQMMRIYQPHQKLVLDEGMTIGKSPRNPIKKVMKNKPIQNGCKTWEVVDEKGVIIYMDLYGRAVRGHKRDEKLSVEVVREFLQRLETQGHVVIMDRFFGNFEALTSIRAHRCSTVTILQAPVGKSDCKASLKSPLYILRDSFTEATPRGAHSELYHRDGYMVQAWKDQKVVYFATDFCSALSLWTLHCRSLWRSTPHSGPSRPAPCTRPGDTALSVLLGVLPP